MVARLLSLRPLVFIGLLSYSLYLWHWPIFSLFELHFGSPSELVRLALIAATFACGYGSWRFVERPFRSGSAGVMQARRRVAVAVAVMGVFGGIGYTISVHRGFPSRLPEQAVAADIQSQRPSSPYLGCIASQDFQPADVARDCVFTTPRKLQQQALIWGDSHAGPFYDALKAEFAALDMEVRRATRNGCVPLIGVVQVDPAGDGDEPCVEFNEMFVRMVEQDPDIRLILLTGRWGRLSGRKIGVAEYRSLVDEDNPEPSAQLTERLLGPALEKTLQRLSKNGADIIMIGPNPEFPVEVPKCVARAYWRGEPPEQCNRAYDVTMTEVGWIEPVLRDVAARFPNVTYVSAISALCDGAVTCPVIAPDSDRLLYFDTNHLNRMGAVMVMKQSQVRALSERLSSRAPAELPPSQPTKPAG